VGVMIGQSSIVKLSLCIAVLLSLQNLAGCQTAQTETYGGGHRKAEAPPAKEIKQAMDATKSRADKDMAAVLTKLQDLNPKPIASLSRKLGRNPLPPMP
jgi:hypothetical protein